MDTLTRSITEGAGVVVGAQEALMPPETESLVRTLSRQPEWSDLPLILLTGSGRAADPGNSVLAQTALLENATLLERPLRIVPLVRAVCASSRHSASSFVMCWPASPKASSGFVIRSPILPRGFPGRRLWS